MDIFPIHNSTADELCDPLYMNKEGSGCEKDQTFLIVSKYVALVLGIIQCTLPGFYTEF